MFKRDKTIKDMQDSKSTAKMFCLQPIKQFTKFNLRTVSH